MTALHSVAGTVTTRRFTVLRRGKGNKWVVVVHTSNPEEAEEEFNALYIEGKRVRLDDHEEGSSTVA